MRTTPDVSACSHTSKMNRYNQPWCQDFGTNFGLDDTHEEASGWMSSLVDVTLPSMPVDRSTIIPFKSPSDTSRQNMNRDMWSESTHEATFHGDDAELFAILAHESSQAAANTPNSFHHRALQTALPRTQPNLMAVLEDQHTEVPSQSHRADSGIGNMDDLPDFNNSTQNPPWIFDHAAYDGRFEDEYFQAELPEENNDEDQHARSLQYHLIKTKSRTSIRNINSDDIKTEVCPLCPNKQYTGVWAHRNLTRHMETMHAPCASSTGLKQITCSFKGCDRTFRREDARLVHERRSHPELNRPPPAKRRRSDDL